MNFEFFLAKMDSKLFGTFVLLTLIPIACSVFKTTSPNAKPQFENGLDNSLLKQELVIQLAIFTDTEFDKLFLNDHKLILQYWEAVLYDVHLRFKTLPSFNISFRVTTLYKFQNPKEEAFLGIGSSRQEPHSLDDIALNFELFSYSKIGRIPNFDIAVLALGTHLRDNKNQTCFTRQNSICVGREDGEQRWYTNVILSMDTHPAPLLAKSIAHILGAPEDDDFEYWTTCNSIPNNDFNCCILSTSRPWQDIEPSFFSHCTNYFLATKLSTLLLEKSKCMNRSAAEKKSLIDTEYLFENPENIRRYSVKQQCQLLARDALASVELDTCMKVECRSSLNQRLFRFVPLDGTPCENNGQCVRSSCVKPKLQLVNVGTGKCMVPEGGLFELNDRPVLRDCSSIPMHVLEQDDLWLEGTSGINMMYSTKNGLNVKHLKLKTDSEKKFVSTFEQNLTDTSAHWLIVRLIGLQREEFVLLHADTMLCAVAADDGINLEFIANGSSVDPASRWKFIRVEGTETLFDTIGYVVYKFWYLVWDNVDLILLFVFSLVLVWVLWKFGWMPKQEKKKGNKRAENKKAVRANNKARSSKKRN